MGNPIELDDAIVLLLGADVPGARAGELRGITRLEKLVFLLERETSSKSWLNDDAEFEPYNFGPFSQKVYQAVDMLAAAELITDSAAAAADDTDTWETRENIGFESPATGRERDPYTTRDFHLTKRGWRYYEALRTELPEKSLRELRTFKKQFAFLPLRHLIRYVYSRYENFTTKSLIRDDVMGPKE